MIALLAALVFLLELLGVQLGVDLTVLGLLLIALHLALGGVIPWPRRG